MQARSIRLLQRTACTTPTSPARGDFMERYKRGDGAVNIELLKFLSDWLTKHI